MRLLPWLMILIFSTLLSIVVANDFKFSYYKDTWRREGTPDSTNLSYSGSLHCPLDRIWCYEAFYVENDLWKDDIEHIVEFDCYANKTVNHEANFVISGGDGVGVDAYDMEIELYHNCTDNGQTVRVDRWLPKIHIQQASGGGNFTWNVFNLGTNIYWRPLAFESVKDNQHAIKSWVTHYEIQKKVIDGKNVFEQSRSFKKNVAESSRTKSTTEMPAVEEKMMESSGLRENEEEGSGSRANEEEGSGEGSGDNNEKTIGGSMIESSGETVERVLETKVYESVDHYMRESESPVPIENWE